MLWGSHLWQGTDSKICTGDRKEITKIVKERPKKKGTRPVPEVGRGRQGEGTGKGKGLGRPLSKGFSLRVWAKEAVKFWQMCSNGLLALWAGWLGQGEATCNRHCGTGLSLFVASLRLLQWTCGNGAAAASSRTT